VAGAELTAPATIAGPWRLAFRRLRRNRVAIAAGASFALLVAICTVGAPLWVALVSHHGPEFENLSGSINENGHAVQVVADDGTPIGPGWRGAYLLGADANGRDLLVRVLYGGRTSLVIGIGSAALCMTLAIALALVAGYRRGIADTVISRGLDLIWSFPVYLLAVAIATVLAVNGLHLGPLEIPADSTMIPIVVIAVVYVPYAARPLRGEVLALREREFVEAAVAHGASAWRTMTRELLPNILNTALVLLALIVANNILTEAALSYLGVGVPLTTPSWGNIIEAGSSSIVTAPMLTVAPGIMIVIAAVSLNVLGDGLRDALDPHGAVRIDP
jgi:peptide/nickel transport system permease protein